MGPSWMLLGLFRYVAHLADKPGMRLAVVSTLHVICMENCPMTLPGDFLPLKLSTVPAVYHVPSSLTVSCAIFP